MGYRRNRLLTLQPQPQPHPTTMELPILDDDLRKHLPLTLDSDDVEFLQAVRYDIYDFLNDIAGFIDVRELNVGSVMSEALEEVRCAIGDLSRVLHLKEKRAVSRLRLQSLIAAVLEIDLALTESANFNREAKV